MEKYEVVDTILGKRYELLGISNEQKHCFEYKISEGFTMRVHISHINVDTLIVYDKKYQLTNDDVDYFYKDLGGVV